LRTTLVAVALSAGMAFGGAANQRGDRGDEEATGAVVSSEAVDDAKTGLAAVGAVGCGRSGGQAWIVDRAELLGGSIAAARVAQHIEGVLVGAATISVGVDREAGGGGGSAG
jgi:hypothetical protein